MPRFAVVEHDHPTTHWDLFLEDGPELRTWRLYGLPGPNELVRAAPVGPHRLVYLDYEGPVSGGRGNVRRFDAGTFEWIVDEPGRVVVCLAGQILSGRAVYVDSESNWTFQCPRGDEPLALSSSE
jgi:DNA polymerase Ligase (LigD)